MVVNESWRDAGAAFAVAATSLQSFLNPQDAVLGPWIPGRDPLHDALQSFAGAPGGVHRHAWEVGTGFGSDDNNKGMSDSCCNNLYYV